MTSELISFRTGTKWISTLRSRLKGIRKNRTEELEKINLIFGDPVEIARYYVEPDCQDRNPADKQEEGILLYTTPAIKIIDNFFHQKRIVEQGGNQMLILSDVGMGKTALLIMLKLMHLASLWPQQKDCVLKKLGENTIKELEEISNKGETILLLDSLDEDCEAFGRVKERFMDILHVTRYFFRVIITCRTQFFPKVDQVPSGLPCKISTGGFTCPVKYLSFFSNENVMIYLNKRFPKRFGFFPNTEKIQQARQAIAKMGPLRCRPMLLACIEDLMGSPLLHYGDNEFRIYDALIQSRLNQEQLKEKKISVKDLLDACMVLATWLQTTKKRNISEPDLDKLVQTISGVEAIRDMEINGRGLINRDSEGNYRFFHYSVQEFLVAKLLLDEQPVYRPNGSIPMTDFIFRMMVLSKNAPNFSELLNCAALNFRGMNLKQFNFSGMNLCGIDFSEANLQDCLFENTTLEGARFSKAKLGGASFDRKSFDRFDPEDADPAGLKVIDKRLRMTFVYIPPGKFMMGDEVYDPVHEVTLTAGFFMQTTPVTQHQWQSVMGENPSRFKKSDPDCPVESVSWNDVQSFIQKLYETEKNRYDLPTESQWEYSCRAGSTKSYCFGDQDNQLMEYAWFYKNSKDSTQPVAQLKPNAWGLYDMHGNVWEWCRDWEGDYPAQKVTDPTGPDNGTLRVLRGGSWCSYAEACRSAYRHGNGPDIRFYSVGLRLVYLPGQLRKICKSGRDSQCENLGFADQNNEMTETDLRENKEDRRS